jgi:pheromone shutdown-related protein TraB
VKYRNLIIIGTSHIARQSLEEVARTIRKTEPEIVAVELDRRRFAALVHEQQRKLRLRDIRRIGLKGYLFNLVGAWIEKKLGKLVGVKPGSEMLAAIRLAKQYGAKVALVDQDIEVTLARLSKGITWKEKFRFIWDLIRSPFTGKQELKRLGISKLDLTKVPSKKVIRKLTGYVKEKYPNVYRVLVEERNKVIAVNLRGLMKHFQDKQILAVIGAGHEEDVMELVKKGL